MTILIRGGTVVNHDHSRRADVLVSEQTIVAIGSNLDAPTGSEVIDAAGCYVMPGGIDPHTHLELAFMGSISADDFEGSRLKRINRGRSKVFSAEFQPQTMPLPLAATQHATFESPETRPDSMRDKRN